MDFTVWRSVVKFKAASWWSGGGGELEGAGRGRTEGVTTRHTAENFRPEGVSFVKREEGPPAAGDGLVRQTGMRARSPRFQRLL